MSRAYYSDSIDEFVRRDPETILGRLGGGSEFPVEQTQREAWRAQIGILKPILAKYTGTVYFEYSIPRMGERIDVVLLIGPVIFVLEFKVGESAFAANALDQVCDYALDLKNFHETSHGCFVAPVLIATKAKEVVNAIAVTPQNDKLLFPLKSTPSGLELVINSILSFADGACIEAAAWESGRYCPTPTIIEAAMALYRNHDVTEISRSDASAKNLTRTTEAISTIIRRFRVCGGISYWLGLDWARAGGCGAGIVGA